MTKKKRKPGAGREAGIKAWSTMDSRKCGELVRQLRGFWHDVITGRDQVAEMVANELYRLYTLHLLRAVDIPALTWGDGLALRALADEIYKRMEMTPPSDLELAAQYLPK